MLLRQGACFSSQVGSIYHWGQSWPKLERELVAGTMEESCSQPPSQSSACLAFLHSPRPSAQGMALPTVGWTQPSASVNNQDGRPSTDRARPLWPGKPLTVFLSASPSPASLTSSSSVRLYKVPNLIYYIIYYHFIWLLRHSFTVSDRLALISLVFFSTRPGIF